MRSARSPISLRIIDVAERPLRGSVRTQRNVSGTRVDGGADPDAWLDVEFRTIFGQSSGDHRMLHASYDSAVSYHSHEWFAGFQELYGLYNQDDQSV